MLEVESKIADLPFWSGTVELEPLSGGLSNQSFVAKDRSGKYVARYGHDIPVHHVIRSREAELSRAAAELEISPRMHWAQDGVMIFDFIEGQTYGPADLQSNLDVAVALVKRCHRELYRQVRGPGYLFWVFHVLRDYVQLLGQEPDPDNTTLARFAKIAGELEAASGEPLICICHADLLAANFIDDGTRLWLIDWEYGGFGNAWFDIGNMAAISGFEQADEARLLELYLESAPTANDWRRFDALRCAANLREALWAMVSEQHLALDIDYAAYTAEQLAGFEKAYAVYRERYGPG